MRYIIKYGLAIQPHEYNKDLTSKALNSYAIHHSRITGINELL